MNSRFENSSMTNEKAPYSDKIGAAIYIHIPFCKQACHYCNYHFSTSLNKKEELIEMICRELILRKTELSEVIETIYFGGGTPSLLTAGEIRKIIDVIYKNFDVSENPEITLEANPDDLSEEKIQELSETPINRLSIGVQSFFEEDLKLMNRAHNSSEAISCISNAKKYFDNISIDLMYGIPGVGTKRWQENLQTAFDFNIPHLSCYALTVEPKTALKTFIEKGIVIPLEDEIAQEQYNILLEMMENEGYDNYEFSNFGKPGYFSRNNTAYWEEKPYLGIGPSAHSFDGDSRSWNIANNSLYIKSIQEGKLPMEREVLSTKDKYNEYVMIALRTKKGILLEKVEADYGKEFLEYLLKQATEHVKKGYLFQEKNVLKLSKNKQFIGDGIAADLFWV